MERSHPDYKKIEQAIGLPADKQVVISFVKSKILNPVKSEELNRPIFEDMDFISRRIPGETDYVSRIVSDKDRQDYPSEWAEYLRTRDHSHAACIPGIGPAEVEMLRCRGVTTVQAAAELQNPDPEIARAVLNARKWMAIEAGEKPRIKLVAA